MEVNAMTTDHETLGHVSDLVHTELTGYLWDL